MKKIITLMLALVMSFALFASCGDEGSVKTENEKPVITGVKDAVSVEAGEEFDALEGVTATDKEDGDLTSKIVVESTPTLEFVNGKATPATAGTYELTYSVTDAGKLTAEAYSTLTVTRATAEATEYLKFDFKAMEGESRGWNAYVDNSVSATATLSEGAYVFDVTNSGENVNSGAVKMSKVINVKKADYKVRVWAKSNVTTYAHLIAKNDSVSEWQTFGGEWNFELGTSIKAYEINFYAAGEENSNRAEIIFEMGKIKPNEEKISPEAYKITIDKVEIYEIVGTETEKNLVTYDFADSVAGVTLNQGKATANLSNDNGAAKVEVTKAGEENWDLKVVIGLGNVKLEAGVKYFYRVTVTSAKAQGGEICLESNAKEWENRAKFDSLSINEGETKTLYASFIAENAIDDPVLKMYVGKNAAGSNVLTIDNFAFGTLEGDKEVTKTLDRFMAYGNGSKNHTNPNYIFDTFNGTDEDNEYGVGTIWTTDGSLFYRIDQASTTDWHNKLFFGYTANPLPLPADSYFTVKIKIKADKNVTCALFLNALGKWDPRVTQSLDITTEEQEFEFTTTETLVTDMNFELLFQFGSASTAELGEVTIEITELVIMQKTVA
ncbi:MAG: hypothetical protein J6N93_06935 [Clostridia bacterium]|nr:hypothetical protein [Clostridia bacterium]